MSQENVTKNKMRYDAACFLCVVAFVTAILIVGVAWKWYRAGVQSVVYQRQGIEISQWEIFIGSKIAEQTINLKQIPTE